MEYTRERVPLQWAGTQHNLGAVLWTLGGRESGTARLEEAVAAFRDALKERTRERVPLDWAMTQNNLGAALQTLGARERTPDELMALRRPDEQTARLLVEGLRRLDAESPVRLDGELQLPDGAGVN